MVRYYCPECWHDFNEDFDICPFCGCNIRRFYETKEYSEKLINALNSPQPGTPERAAMLLGKLKDAGAVRALIDRIESTDDVFLVIEAARALGEIGGKTAMNFLYTLENHRSKIVSDAVKKITGRINKNK